MGRLTTSFSSVLTAPETRSATSSSFSPRLTLSSYSFCFCSRLALSVCTIAEMNLLPFFLLNLSTARTNRRSEELLYITQNESRAKPRARLSPTTWAVSSSLKPNRPATTGIIMTWPLRVPEQHAEPRAEATPSMTSWYVDTSMFMP